MSFSKEQIQAFNALEIEERFKKTISQIKESKKLVILSDKGGFVTMALDEKEEDVVIPLWSDENLAKECAEGEWKGATPDVFDLEEWITFILPELADDGIMIAVAASKEDDGFILSAKAFADALQGEDEE